LNARVIVIIVILLLSFTLGLGSCINVYPSSPQEVTTPTTNPQTTPTPADNQGINPQVTPAPTVAATATPTMPDVPAIPSDVLAIWKSEPASESLTPYTAGDVLLKLNTHGNPVVSSSGSGNMGVSYYAISEGADQTTSKFYLEEGQWIDIIVSSVDVPIYFQNNKPGGVSFDTMGWDPVSGYQLPKVLGLTAIPNAFHHPYSEKTLYENEATGTYVGSTSGHEATLFSTAARIFAPGGAGNYAFVFTNFNSQKGADIQYRVYKLGVTLSWGDTYANAILAPWLRELRSLQTSGTISKDEYDSAISQWLEQLK
jgi:hypothetical protein